MGKRNRSLIIEPSVFFVTSSFKNWVPLFSTHSVTEKVEDLLFHLFPSYADTLMGYVLMPSHVHFLVGCRGGGNQLSKFMKTFKSLSARKFFPGVGSIWIERFDDLRITTEKQLWIKLNYIHENPVRKGLVSKAIDWPWSSARFWILNEQKGVLTKEWDWL